jgi:PAS domain S-box-containing protein
LLAYLQIDQFADDRRIQARVAQSWSAESRLYQLLSLFQDIETGQRGYVLTGNRAFLQPYFAARESAKNRLAAVGRSLAGDRELQPRLARLEVLIDRKLAFAERAIAVRDNGGQAAAAALVATGEGKTIMDEARTLVDNLVGVERRELAGLRHSASRTRARVQVFSASLQLFLLALLGFAFAIYVRQIKQLRVLTGEARDNSARQAAIFTAATDAVVILDRDGTIEAANPAAERLFGYANADLDGRPVGDLFARRPKDATIRMLLQRLLARQDTGGFKIQHFTGKRKGGAMFEADVATSPVELAEEPRFLLVIRDATERRRVDQLKSEFVSTVSHELRTPLTSIAGSLGLVAAGAAGPLEPRAAKLVGIALANSQRLIRLINDILDIEKIESGKMSFDLRRFALRGIVEDAIQANLGFAAQQQVTITLAPGGEQAVVITDHDRLMQVLTNLLSNAVKFSPAGGSVDVILTPGSKRHRISICDHGPGIPPEFQPNLFTRFAQADHSDSRSKGGTGLGLAIVKEILDRTDGEIWYETSDAGTAFHVELAAQRNQRRRGVLLIQVEEPVVGEIRTAVAARGMEIELVNDLTELEAAAERRPYDAVVLGLAGGGRAAAAMVQSIRSNPSLATVPILAAVPVGSDGQVSPAIKLVDWLCEPPSSRTVTRGAELVRPADGIAAHLRVLHIEDDEDIVGLVRSAFGAKATITAARNADEAREALARDVPDLVILDLGLPGESGVQLLPSLHRPDGVPIPVVIYTARDEDPEIASRALAMLTKSKASLDDLVHTVMRIIQDQEAERS